MEQQIVSSSSAASLPQSPSSSSSSVPPFSSQLQDSLTNFSINGQLLRRTFNPASEYPPLPTFKVPDSLSHITPVLISVYHGNGSSASQDSEDQDEEEREEEGPPQEAVTERYLREMKELEPSRDEGA
jgi:hypothetical protein